MKKLETENKEMKEKLKELNLDKNSRSNNTNEIEGINKLEEKIKQLEAKLSDSQNLNAGFEKKISIYSKEMESRFKKLIQESEKKEIENKDLIKKNESLLNKLQENDKNLSNSSSANVKCDILNQENSELKKQNQALVEALENLEGKIINLQKKFQVGNNKKENHEDIEAYNALKEKFANLELQKNKLESECSQAKVDFIKIKLYKSIFFNR